MSKQTKVNMPVDEELRKQVNKPERSHKKLLIIIAVIIGSIVLLPVVLMMVLLTLGGWLN